MADKEKLQNRSISCRSTFRPLEESNAIIKAGQLYGTISTPSFVTCNSDEPVDYRVLLNTNASAEHILSPDFIYGLSGKLLPLNTPAPPVLNYYLEMVAKICPAAQQIEDSTDKTFTSGPGVVIFVAKPKSDTELDSIENKKMDLIIHVNHSDWDPADRIVKSFDVKYLVPSNPKLIKTHSMLRVGREFFFDGYLYGWDLKARMAIIKVLSFSPIAMANTGSMGRNATPTPQTSPINKGRKFVTFGEENLPTSLGSGRCETLLPQHKGLEIFDKGEGSSRSMSAGENLQDEDEIPLSLIPSPKGKGKAPEASTGNKKKRNAPGN